MTPELQPSTRQSPGEVAVPGPRKTDLVLPAGGGNHATPVLPAGGEVGSLRLDIPRIPRSHDDKVTRIVCHSAHLSEPLQSFAHYLIVDPPARAISPAFGIDLVAVARHVSLARARRILRDRLILACRAAIAVSAAAGVLLTVVSAAGPSGIDTAPLAAAGAVIAACVVAAWAVLLWHVRAARASARAVLNGPRPSDQASPLPQATEDRLDEAGRPNVMVYARDQGDPFIGSGRRLAQWQTDPIDITRAAENRTATPFNEIELHHYLETEIPRIGFDDLEVSNRLYVRGDRARHIGGLVPDLSGMPRSLLAANWVAAGLTQQSEHARTYVCTERIQMGGDLVTCMYLRTRVEQSLMSIDGLIYFLPPLADLWLPERNLLAGGKACANWVAARTASRETIPVLRGRSALPWRPDVFRADARQARKFMQRELKDGLDHDYGAVVSLREALAGYDTTHYYQVTDVVDSAKRLMQRQVNCIVRFLDDHGIDTSALREQAARIYQQISYTAGDNISVGKVEGGTNIIGSHGAVNNFGHSGARPPDGSSPQAGPPRT